jgi:hypothetical protein
MLGPRRLAPVMVPNAVTSNPPARPPRVMSAHIVAPRPAASGDLDHVGGRPRLKPQRVGDGRAGRERQGEAQRKDQHGGETRHRALLGKSTSAAIQHDSRYAAMAAPPCVASSLPHPVDLQRSRRQRSQQLRLGPRQAHPEATSAAAVGDRSTLSTTTLSDALFWALLCDRGPEFDSARRAAHGARVLSVAEIDMVTSGSGAIARGPRQRHVFSHVRSFSYLNRGG